MMIVYSGIFASACVPTRILVEYALHNVSAKMIVSKAKRIPQAVAISKKLR